MNVVAGDLAKQARVPMSDVAYQSVKGLILNNHMLGGYQILEDELARDLQMSRTPLREALVRLEHEGLIQLVPRHGIRVIPLSAADIHEIYQVLTALETVAAELLASKIPNQAEVASLEGCVDQMQRALDADDLTAWAEADERFHRTLVQSSGNRRLATTAFNYLDQSHRFRMFTLRLRDKPVSSTQSHADLVKAIKATDPDLARQIHSKQKAGFRSEMERLMEAFNIRQL
jgi:DNA-binding GntR family transcriptional regulator